MSFHDKRWIAGEGRQAVTQRMSEVNEAHGMEWLTLPCHALIFLNLRRMVNAHTATQTRKAAVGPITIAMGR